MISPAEMKELLHGVSLKGATAITSALHSAKSAAHDEIMLRSADIHSTSDADVMIVPKVNYVKKLWDNFYNTKAKLQYNSALFEFLVSILLSLGLIPFFLLDMDSEFLSSWDYSIWILTMLLFLAASLFYIFSTSVRFFEAKSLGFMRNKFLPLVTKVYGSVWLLTPTSLVIVNDGGKGKQEFKFVSYKTIGLASVGVNELQAETLVLSGRDGGIIAEMPAPFSSFYISPQKIADAINTARICKM